MSETILNKERLIANIRQLLINNHRLKYQRALLEFENMDGSFLGDNVFETTFLLRGDQAPLIYEVSGPYDVISNEYATTGRIYEKGQCVSLSAISRNRFNSELLRWYVYFLKA